MGVPEQVRPQPINIDHILTRQPDAPISSVDDLFCELPPCDLVKRSRLESDRCGALGEKSPDVWPLLVTATPRSATAYMTSSLQQHGMEIQDDWRPAKRDGRVSWIHAFNDSDKESFGPGKAHGKRYKTALHQMKEPLSAITSMCTEPVLGSAKSFIRRHIPIQSSHVEDLGAATQAAHRTRSTLEFWIEWHTFITSMRFPTFRVFETDLQDVFSVSGLHHLYKDKQSNISTKTNSRKHRSTFTWQDLYTIDPANALKAWELAHFYGYDYPLTNFSNLTCLDRMPVCGNSYKDPSDRCPPKTHPPSSSLAARTIVPPSTGLGFAGWVDSGCVEVQLSNGSYAGVRGLVSEAEFDRIQESLDPSVRAHVRRTMLSSRGTPPKTINTTMMDDRIFFTMQWALLAMGTAVVSILIAIQRNKRGSYRKDSLHIFVAFVLIIFIALESFSLSLVQ